MERSKVSMMKRIVVLCMVLVFVGCRKKPELRIYNWADYIAPDVIEEFEKREGCRVIYDTFDSNEILLAKLQAGASGYDLIFPSHYVVDAMKSTGVIVKLDHSKIPSVVGHLDKDILSQMPDKECEYTIPYMISYTGIGYNKEAVKDFKASWKMFERTDLQKRATLLDDKREVIGAALLANGLDPNSTDPGDLAKARDTAKAWAKNVSKFENEQYKNGLASKEFVLVMGYSGDIIQAMDENQEIAFAIPEEGAMMSCDVVAMPATAKNTDLAYKFIEFLHTPEIAAKNIEYVYYLCPNSDAYPLVSDEVKSNPAVFVEKETLSRCRFVVDQGEKEAMFNTTWEEIKSGK